MAAPKTNHHVTEDGKHLVVHLKRVGNVNAGEIAAYDPKIAAHLCEPHTVDGKVIDPAGAYAAKIYLLKAIPHKHLGPPGPDIEPGRIVAVSESDADMLVNAGKAAYVTAGHLEELAAKRKAADQAHLEAQAGAILSKLMNGSQAAQAQPKGK